MFITSITWTKNMPRHDKVKINQVIGQTGGKYRSSTFVLIALFPLACLIFSTPPHQKKIVPRRKE